MAKKAKTKTTTFRLSTANDGSWGNQFVPGPVSRYQRGTVDGEVRS